jgi:hypothetical protein
MWSPIFAALLLNLLLSLHPVDAQGINPDLVEWTTINQRPDLRSCLQLCIGGGGTGNPCIPQSRVKLGAERTHVYAGQTHSEAQSKFFHQLLVSHALIYKISVPPRACLCRIVWQRDTRASLNRLFWRPQVRAHRLRLQLQL